MELLSKVLHTEVPGKGRSILLISHFPEFLSSMCLLWLTSLATPSLLMWKQPVPAEQFHNTSSRGWIWRQNLHHNRLNVQLTEGANWNVGVQPACIRQENPPDHIPGHDASLQPLSPLKPGEQLVLVLPYLLPCWISQQQVFIWGTSSVSLLAALGRSEQQALWREAVLRRGEGPEKHLILINKKGAFNSCLPFRCWGRISCIQADVWPWRCSSMGWAEGSFTGCLKDLGDLPHDVFLSNRNYSNEKTEKAGKWRRH